MYIIKKDRKAPIFDKNIKLKMSEQIVDISLKAYTVGYMKNLENIYAYNIIILDNNINKTILNIELFDSKKINEIYKSIDTILHTNFELSLSEKIENIYKLLINEKIIEDNFFIDSNYRLKEIKAPVNNDIPKKQYINNHNNNPSDNKGKFTKSFNDTFNEIPIVYILESLYALGHINIEKGPEKNGDEAFYWIEMPNESKSSKVSVLSRDSLEKKKSSKIIQKFNMIRDLNNNVLTTESASGFLSRLKDNGLFPDKEIFDIKQELIKSKGGFSGFVRIDKDKEELIGEGGETLNITSIDYPSRMPTVYYGKKVEEFRSYLINERKIDADIIDKEIKNKQILTGLFADFNNYVEFGMGFFKLKYFNNDYESTYEKFKLNKETNKLERKHLSGVQIKGRSHIIKGSTPKMTVFSEAVIDSCSLYNLFKLSSKINEENYNYVALAGVGNIKGWLEYNLGISLNSKTKDELKNTPNIDRIYIIEKQKVIIDNQEKKKEDLRSVLSDKNLYFIKEETNNTGLNKIIEGKIFLLQSVLKHISPDIKLNIVVVNDKQKIDYDMFQKATKESESKDYILDKTNIDVFLLNNGIEAKYDSTKKQYIISFFEEVQKEIPLKEDNIEMITKIRERFIQLTGTDSIGFAFDNDTPALKKCEPLEYLGNVLGLKPTFLIPTFNFGINDNNDMLKAYKKLNEEQQSQQANYIMNSVEQQILRVGTGLPNNFNQILDKAREIESKKKLDSTKLVSPKP